MKKFDQLCESIMNESKHSTNDKLKIWGGIALMYKNQVYDFDFDDDHFDVNGPGLAIDKDRQKSFEKLKDYRDVFKFGKIVTPPSIKKFGGVSYEDPEYEFLINDKEVRNYKSIPDKIVKVIKNL